MAEVPQIIQKGDDGFYHPENEEQIIALVKYAGSQGLEVRCRGAAHSLAWAIYTDPGAGQRPVPNKVSEQNPPAGPNVNIMLNKFRKLSWIDECNGIIEVETGIHLGRDPSDPLHDSSLRQSLLYQIFRKGWALSDLGGITHQTVGGFLSTGSAGGSLTYDLGDNLLAFRVIDGEGNVEWVEKENNPELFNALGVSLGLLGIITAVRLKLTPNFFIYGQEVTTPTTRECCPIDLFGEWDSSHVEAGQIVDRSERRAGREKDVCSEKKVGMVDFLKRTPYTRILWWPQKGVERIVIWEAVRGPALPVFEPVPYTEFEDDRFLTQLEQMGGALMFTLLGNRGVFKVWKKLGRDFQQFRGNVGRIWRRKFGGFLGSVLTWLVTTLVIIVSFVLVLVFGLIPPLLRALYPMVVRMLQPLTKKGKPKLFMDYMWRSLPMDNAADDILMGTEFTEIWVPLAYTDQAMRIIRDMFEEGGYASTGFYSTELYAGYPSDFWLSPGYGGDMFRIDFFWYINNEGDPAKIDGFFRQFWDRFRFHNVPFRLHWGKFLPEYEERDWARYFQAQYPRWDDFLALRARRDPKNIFLTDYWRLHLLGEEMPRQVSPLAAPDRVEA